MTNGYPDHYLMKMNRIKRLKATKGKCEICGKDANTVHHKDETKDNHDESNLLVVCCKCHHALHSVDGHKKTSKMFRMYGMSVATMIERFGGKRHKFYELHKRGVLRDLIENPTKMNVKHQSKYVRIYGLTQGDLARKYDLRKIIICRMHLLGTLANLIKDYPEGLKIADHRFVGLQRKYIDKRVGQRDTV